MSLPYPATDEQATLWHCEACGESGVLIIDPGTDVYAVVTALRKVHANKLGGCEHSEAVRVTPPNDWLKSFRELWKESIAFRNFLAKGKTA